MSQIISMDMSHVAGELMKSLGLKNAMQVPRVVKVCVNVGIGSYLQRIGKKDYSFVLNNIERITGQKPVVNNSRMSVSNFKVREGMPVGVSVTLRGKKAHDFLQKMVHVVFPRVRDFTGVKKNIFDKFGNCSFGFNDHTVFPEAIRPENTKDIHGVQIVVVTTAKNPEQGRALMKSFQFPFKK